MTERFGGDKKIGTSILTNPEQRFIRWMVPKIPPWINSYHLTLASLPISLSIVLTSYLARLDIRWLWSTTFCIMLQWLTDSLDGAVGRTRREGFILWGYYMDHFFDYLFLCSILIGYSLLLPSRFLFIHIFVLAVSGAYMVNSFLAFAATNEFRIAYFGLGPTEARIAFIIINTLIIIFGKTYLASALPYILVLSIVGLGLVVYRTQKHLWEKDLEIKRQETPSL